MSIEERFAQLELERAQLKSLIDTLPDLVWLKDTSGIYLACNERFSQFYGAPVHEILGCTDYDFVDAEQADYFRVNDLNAVRAGQPTMNEEWITYASDGHIELLETIKTPMYDKAGELIGVLGIGRNITQRDEAAKRLQYTIDTVEALIVQLDVQGRVTLINHRALTLLDLSAEQALGRNWFELSMVGQEVAHYSEHILDFIQHSIRLVEEAELPLSTVSHGKRTISWTFRKLKDSSGQLIGCLGAGLDITKRLEAKEQFKLAAIVFQQANEAIMVCDSSRCIINVNPAFTKITGFENEEVVGSVPACFIEDHHSRDEVAEMWHQLNRSGSWVGEIWNMSRTGEAYLAKVSATTATGVTGDITHYVFVFSDVTESFSQNEILRSLAHYDSLTDLPNRVLLQDRLEQAIARSRRNQTNLAVCFLDLDNFKPVNDNHGHEVGDALLVTVARRLRSVPREVDTIARYGGDEFVIVLNDVGDQSSCGIVVKRLLEALEPPIVVSGHEFQICASIGITIYPNDGADGGTLLRHADQAMYQAKLLGRNQYRFYDATRDSHFTLQEMQKDKFREALYSGEMQLYFQPTVALQSGEVVGVEALLRWLDPERGLLTAGAFLPDISDSALAIELDQWVIERALEQMNEWRRLGLELKVSVNISASTLQRRDFVLDLQRALESHSDLMPSSLILEIVESAALGDVSLARTVFEECQKLGVQIALDDFGTGYASLTYFRRLPVDWIKIDRSFVTDLNSNEEDLAIVTSVVSLAKAFGRALIAEGVESVATIQTLNALGCDAVQGYAIARPMPADELYSWLGARAKRVSSEDATPSLGAGPSITYTVSLELPSSMN